MKSVVRIQRQGKVKLAGPGALAAVPGGADVDSRVALIQALIPLGLEAVADALEAEVVALAGARYRRTGGQPGYVRWSQQTGSVYLLDQKLPIRYTRVRDLRRNVEVPRATYDRLRAPRAADESSRGQSTFSRTTGGVLLGRPRASPISRRPTRSLSSS